MTDIDTRAPLGTNDDILRRYHGVISRDRYWNLKRHPNFPKPVLGGPGGRQIYNLVEVDEFLANLRGVDAA